MLLGNGIKNVLATGSLGAVLVLLGTTSIDAQALVYLASPCSQTVSVLDSATNTTIRTVSIAQVAREITATPDGAFVYVATAGGFAVIDTAKNAVVADVSFPGFGGPSTLAITPDGQFVYAGVGGFILVIDRASNALVTTIPVGGSVTNIVFTPNGTRAYVIEGVSRTVQVIDTVSRTVIATIPVTYEPHAMAMTPDGLFVYVATWPSRFVGFLSVIGTTSNTVVGTVQVGGLPTDVAITPDGAFAYVGIGLSSNVQVIDTVSNTIVASVHVTNPIGDAIELHIAVTPDGTVAYVAGWESSVAGQYSSLTPIETATNTAIATLPAACPAAIVIASVPTVPTSKEQCKADGFRRFGPPAGPFKNQGSCVSYVEKGSKVAP